VELQALAHLPRPCTIWHMVLFRASIVVPVLLIALSGCASYDPPIRGDHMSDHYKADLEACRTSSSQKVYLRNADNLWSWIISPFTGPRMVRAEIRACMVGKGYVLEGPRG
jgi:hypothetical protein